MTGVSQENIIRCPNCGYEVKDDELCRACGTLLEDTPIRNVSLARGVGRFFTRLKDKGFHGDETKKPFIGDPGAAPFFFDEEIEKLHE